MKILLIGSFYHPMYAPAFELGFKKLGHEVFTINYDEFLYKSNLLGSLLNRIQNRFHYGFNLNKYNKTILLKAEKYKPDFIFLYRCYNVWPSTVEFLKKKGHFIITYNNDDPFSKIPSAAYYRYFQACIPLADVNFVYRKKNITDYKSLGGKNIIVLLPYYIKNNNYQESCNKTIPVAFLGHFENDGRDKYIKALLDANVDVTVFNGSDWEYAPLYEKIKGCIKVGKRGTEYNHTINKCLIAVVFLSKINNDKYTRRCFEIPATATLMLSEYTDELNEMFPENECACYFRNEKELVEKCNYLLNNPAEIKRIAQNGLKRLNEIGGSEIDRCNQIIETYKTIKR